MADYVDSLITEFHNLSLVIGHWSLKTVFFGGGTPTLLEPHYFNKIIDTIICHLSLDIGHSEISIEANPGTADKAKLKALRDLGINRLSIGVQSFNDRHLNILGRIHTAEQALRFYDDARSAGFTNINLDLMFALPGQSVRDWQNDLQTALALQPEHLSTYNLQVEENTPLWGITKSQATNNKQITNPKFQLPNEEAELEMYEYTIETLTKAGYKHYEISNFAKPGFECRHNINYWENGNYIGIGAGAHSHINGKRWSNPNCVEEYIRRASGEVGNDMRNELRGANNGLPIAADQHETLFLGLRLLDGLPIEKFCGFEKEVNELIKDRMLKLEDNHYKLTHKGLLLGNLVFEKFV